MGTRADFYVGRGTDAEWLGSIAWDGYPEGIPSVILASDEKSGYRHAVLHFLNGETGSTVPEQGWPWPWDDSRTTDYAYAFDGGEVYCSYFGCPWSPAVEWLSDDFEPRAGDKVEFPDMSVRKNVQLGGPRSGLIVIKATREAP